MQGIQRNTSEKLYLDGAKCPTKHNVISSMEVWIIYIYTEHNNNSDKQHQRYIQMRPYFLAKHNKRRVIEMISIYGVIKLK